MFQENEIISLVSILVSIPVLLFVFKIPKLPYIKLIYLSFFFLSGGYLFTVLEEAFWSGFFKFIEHLCYASSGIFFALSCWQIDRQNNKQNREP